MKPDPDVLPADLLAVASDWARRCAAGLSMAERRQFELWIAADPRHRRALAKANREGVDCDWAWQAGATDEIVLGLASRARRRRHRRAMMSVAAVMILGVTGALWQWHRQTIAEADGPDSSLVILKPQSLQLPDGSTVELKDDAIVTTDFSGPTRAVCLKRGTAYFHVAKDPKRPFIVSAGRVAVRAVGTAFTVELADKELTILVTEGRVRVDNSEPATRAIATPTVRPLASIDAGNAVVLPVATPVAAELPQVRMMADADLREQTSWRVPKLEFSGTSLREIVEQMNGYNQRQFVLGDKATGELRVSGILRADRMEALEEMLAANFGVKIEQAGDQVVLRCAK